MKTDSKNKCGHEHCHCTVSAGATYCNELCEQQAKAEPGNAGGCPCGHPGCETHSVEPA